jgi:hypothetical protein
MAGHNRERHLRPHFDKLTETANPDFLNVDVTITKKLGNGRSARLPSGLLT